jgi:hypothetical protein
MYDVDQNNRTTPSSHGGNTTIGIGRLVHLGAIGSNQYDRNATQEEQPFASGISIDDAFTLFGNDLQTRVNKVNSDLNNNNLTDVNENTKAVMVDLQYNAPRSEPVSIGIYKQGAKGIGKYGGDVRLYDAIKTDKIRSISNERKNIRLKAIEKATIDDLHKSGVGDDPRDAKPKAVETNQGVA